MRNLGSKAEEKVCLYFKKQGYLLVAKNFRLPRVLYPACGEIDLILQKSSKTVVLCEVKSRFTWRGQAIDLALSRRQLLRIKATRKALGCRYPNLYFRTLLCLYDWQADRISLFRL